MCAMLSVPQFLHHDNETNSLFQNTKDMKLGFKTQDHRVGSSWK